MYSHLNLIRVAYAVRRLCSDFMDMLRRFISCRIITIIIIIIIIKISAICSFVSLQSTRVTDIRTDGRRDVQTDRQTELRPQYRAYITVSRAIARYNIEK